MSEEIRISVTLPTDEEGMVGRTCPKCKQYFKVKPGTGLANISTCTCPYCEQTADSGDFLTPAQTKYVESIAIREALGPVLHDLEMSLRDLEISSRNSLVSIQVKTEGFDLPIEYYSEQDLETIITCDNCGLVFAVFGVFATCADCAKLTAMSMFRKSLEAARKRLSILPNIPLSETDLRQALVADTLLAAVSTFDSLGKRLQKEFPTVIPARPRNLFQNLDALSEILLKHEHIDLLNLVGIGEYAKVYYMFQVRHIWSHNFGEADVDFVKKTGCDEALLGIKIVPSESDVDELLTLLEKMGVNLRGRLHSAPNANQ